MTARDELVTLLSEHEEWRYDAETTSRSYCDCGELVSTSGSWAGSDADHRAHLADVLIAAGWSRPAPAAREAPEGKD